MSDFPKKSGTMLPFVPVFLRCAKNRVQILLGFRRRRNACAATYGTHVVGF